MSIKRATQEDLALLDLLVSKLEERMDSDGIKFFNYELHEADISDIGSERNDLFDSYEDPSLKYKELTRKPVKRVEIQFNSKADFRDRWSLERSSFPDDGIYAASLLGITWDYYTNVFSIYVGTQSYEKEVDKHKSGQNTTIRASHTDSSHTNIDFGFKNRREIISIKVRLGKLYSKLKSDRLTEEENMARKKLLDTAMQAFPDIIDSLILGRPDEKRDDR